MGFEKMATLTSVLLYTCSLMLLYVSTQRLDFQDTWYQGGYHVSNCNRSVLPFYLKSLNFSPHPVELGKAIVMNTSFDLTESVGVNGKMIEVELNLRLKTDRGYTELCEIIGEDNCHYNDLCENLRKLMKHNHCPPFMTRDYQNNCSCPFIKNNYKIPNVLVNLPKLPFQLYGTFDITVNLQEEGTHIGCINLQFCITNCKPLGEQ